METPIQSKWISGMLFPLTFLLISCAHLQHSQWPLIKEASIRHHFAPDKQNEQLKAVIYDQGGKPIYGVDARLCWRDYETEDYDFSGVLDCRLYPLGESSLYPTLLQNTTNATRDWQTYGRFTREDVIGLVGADASRSLVQQCWVRGMSIKIDVLNVREQKGNGAIESLDMIFTVNNDPTASADVAAQSWIDNLTGGP